MRQAGWKDWLVYSDLHVLLVSAGWMLGGSALMGYELPWTFVLLGACGAFLIYRLDHWFIHSPEDHLNAPQRLAHAKGWQYPLIVFAALLAFLALLSLAEVIRQDAWPWTIALLIGTLGLIYPLRVLPGGRRPKDLPALKTLLIVSCWVGGGILLPAVLFGQGEAMQPFGGDELAAVVSYRVLYVLPNLIAVDWLDREGDRVERAGNLVSQWTRRGAKSSIFIIWAMATMLLALLFVSGSNPVLLSIEWFGVTGLSLMAVSTISIREFKLDGMIGRAVLLDLWVAFPLITWLWWFFG